MASRRCDQREERSNATEKKCIYINSGDCGKIIGRGGSRIRELQDLTKTRISVARQEEKNGTKKVEVTGLKADVQNAVIEIQNLVITDSRHSRMVDNSTRYTRNKNTTNHRNVDQGSWHDSAARSTDGQGWTNGNARQKTTKDNVVTNSRDMSSWSDDEEDTKPQATSTRDNSVMNGQATSTGEKVVKNPEVLSTWSSDEDEEAVAPLTQEYNRWGGGNRGGGWGGGWGNSSRPARNNRPNRRCNLCKSTRHITGDCHELSGIVTKSGTTYGWRAEHEELGPKQVMFADEEDMNWVIGNKPDQILHFEEECECTMRSSCNVESGEVQVTLFGMKKEVFKFRSRFIKLGIDFREPASESEEEEDRNRPIDLQKYWKEREEKIAAFWRSREPIKKEFYEEEEHIRNMHPADVIQFRRENNDIMVDNSQCPHVKVLNPVLRFEDAFRKYPSILAEMKKQNFEKPSPIQSQAWPILLSGSNLIGIAQTGTGKTLAFLLPALIHIDNQIVPRNKRDGPTALVLCPTRELALQIQAEVEKFSYKGIRSACVYGGGSRREQVQLVVRGVEIVVATPGRLMDLMREDVLSLKSVSYFVLDEADRMLDLGFKNDIRSIAGDINPNRQTVMTSATWPESVQELANSHMQDPIKVQVGSLDLAAVHSVEQRIIFMEDREKKGYLYDFLQNMDSTYKVLVFAGRKGAVDDLTSDLLLRDIRCDSIHGDRDQSDRVAALDFFKSGEIRILIATDVASRGLHVDDVTHVINFDFPFNIEEYVHRIGRTGRAGGHGVAISYMTRHDWQHARALLDIMAEAHQEIPYELQKMAERYENRKENPRQGRNNRGRKF